MGRLQKGKEFFYILIGIKRQSEDPNLGLPDSSNHITVSTPGAFQEGLMSRGYVRNSESRVKKASTQHSHTPGFHY